MIEGILSRIPSITSFWFFLFVLVVAIAYYAATSKTRWIVLLMASAVFFVLATGWKLYALFLAQVLLAWGGVLLARKFAARQKAIISAVIVMETLALVLMKENSFFIINANIALRIFGVRLEMPQLNWLAPLGMSYYTLMLISYVLDVAWGRGEPQKNPLKLALYAGFFPQMISGPFTRYHKINGELFGEHKFNLAQAQYGVQRFLWGLFKKLVIAERLAVIVATIYGGGTEAQMGTVTFEGLYIIIGAFAYVFQLYTDFSGCMDMAIGIAQIFGINLPENFNTPFYSVNLSEFWRRWHITLGLWLRDYVLYPVLKSGWLNQIRVAVKARFGKKAAKNIPTYIGMLVTWFSIGFWHGGSWKYICASGLFFFAMIAGGMLLAPVFKRLTKLLQINTEAWSWTLFARLRTACLFTLSVSFGRASSISGGLKMWRGALKWNPWVLVDGSLSKLGLDAPDFWVMLFGLAAVFVISKFQQSGSVRQRIDKQNLVFRWALYLGLFAATLLFGMYGEGYNPADFIYGGF